MPRVRINTNQLSNIWSSFLALPTIEKATVVSGALLGIGLIDLINIPMRKFFSLELGWTYSFIGAVMGIVGVASLITAMGKSFPDYGTTICYTIIALGAIVLGRKIYKIIKFFND